jgi:trimeric autotransporter adhesin
MAKIKNTTAYPTVTPADNDLLIGTDVNDNNKTVTFTVSSIGGGAATNQDLNSVLGVGNISTLNIELNGSADAGGSSISASDIFPTTISAGGLGSHGLNGQVLLSTGTGISWGDSPGLNQSWNDTLLVSPVATANPNLTGVFTIQSAGGLSILGTSYFQVSGPSTFFNNATLSDGVNLLVSDQSQIGIDDGTGTYQFGSVGQFLSATATGLAWTSAPSLTTPTLQQVVTAGNTLLNSSIVFTGTGGISLAGTNSITGQGNIILNGDALPTQSATQGRITISQGHLSLTGPNTELLLFGSPGTSGQALISNGQYATPTWQTVAGINENLQQVLDNGNTATQNIALTGDFSLAGGGLKLASNAFIELNTDRGTAGQVLISGGPTGFPSWASAGTGTVTGIIVADTTYLDMTVDSTVAATPTISTSLITNASITTGPGGLTTAFYDDDTTGTGYSIANNLSTVALSGSGSGIVVNIVSTSTGSVVLSDLTFVSGGSGYAASDRIQVLQVGSNNDLVIEIDSIATGTYYEQNGRFSEPAGKDWDLTVTENSNVITITNSDGTRSSNFTLQGTGGATFTATGNAIDLGFSGSGTGTVQSISLTDSSAVTGTAIGSVGTFTFSEQAATTTLLRTTSAVSGLGITLSTEIPTIQAVASIGSILTDTQLTIRNGNGTSSSAFILGTTSAPSNPTNGQVVAYNNATGGYMEWVDAGSGGYTSWTLSDNQSPANTTDIDDGETVTISGGAGIGSVLNTGTRVLTLTNTGVKSIIGGSFGTGFGGNVTLSPSGDVTIGEDGATGISGTITTPGTNYVVGRIYRTTVNTGSGTGATIKVNSIGGSGEILTAIVHSYGAGYTVSEILTLTGGGSSGTGQVTISSISGTGDINVSVPDVQSTYDLSVVQNGSDADITLLGSDGTTDIVKLDAGTDVALTVSGNSVLIDASGTGMSSFGIATSPASTAGTINDTNNTLTFTEQVNTINAVNYSYIGLDITATNILTVGLTAPTSGLNGTTVSQSYLRADNTWSIPPNTEYSVFTGASSGNDGTTGLVPQPIGDGGTDYDKFLKGDGTWATPSGSGTLTGVSVTLPLTVDVTDPAVPALNINNFTGATSSTLGLKGTVPPPAIGEEGTYLKGDGTWGNPVTSVSLTDSAGNVGTAITNTGSFTITGSGSGFVNTTVTGTSIDIKVTDTNTTYTADSTSLTLSGTEFSITTGSSSDLTLGVTPSNLAGAPGNGGLNQVLASDGAGGFSWGNPAAAGVNKIIIGADDLQGDIRFKSGSGTGDTTVGLNGAGSLQVTTAGTAYELNMIYPTSVDNSVEPGSDLYIKVTGLGSSGSITSASVYSAGKDWTVGDTVFVVNEGSEGTQAKLTIAAIDSLGTISFGSFSGNKGTKKVIANQWVEAFVPQFRDNDTLVDSNIISFTPKTVPGSLTNDSTLINYDPTQFTSNQPVSGYGLNVGTRDIGIRGQLVSNLATNNIRIGAIDTLFTNSAGGPTTDALAAFGNVNVGGNAGAHLTTGNYNTNLGTFAGGWTGSGSLNTFIGSEAGGINLNIGTQPYPARSGQRNVAIGYRSYGYGIGSKDVAIGESAGNNLSNPGDDDTQILPVGRTAIGTWAMAGTVDFPIDRHTAATHAVAIGFKAFQYPGSTAASVGGNYGGQVFIGGQAGQGASATSSTAATAGQIGIGSLALQDNEGRAYTVAIGYKSCWVKNLATTDTRGVYIGNESGSNANATVTGEGNIAIGYKAQGFNTSGIIQGHTIAIGTEAMAQGEDSIAIGRDSIASAGTGIDDSIAIGHLARSEATSSIALGRSANVQHSYSVGIGYGATTDANNQIAFGSSINGRNLGTVTQTAVSTEAYWEVQINGTDYRILLGNVN